MLVYLFLWFYLVTIIVCECNAFQEFAEAEEKSASRKYRNPDRGFKKHFVLSQSNSLLPHENPMESEIPNVNINDLISRLRDNWEAPSTYLEKRGYLSKRNSKSAEKRKKEHKENGGLCVKSARVRPKNLYKYRNEKPSEDSFIKLANEKKFYYFPMRQKSKKQSEDTTTDQPPTHDTSIEPSQSDTASKAPLKQQKPSSRTSQKDTENSKGFLSKFKTKLGNLFRSSKNSASRQDRLNYSSESTREGAAAQKFFDFKYDDSWLKDDNNDIFDMDNDSTGCSKDSLLDSNNSLKAPPCSNDKCASSTDGDVDITLKYDDIFKNLTQADLDYVKNFLKCFKENKAKFFIEYLHMNKTEPDSSGLASTASKNSTEQCTPIGTDEKPKANHNPATSKPVTTTAKTTTTKKVTTTTTPKTASPKTTKKPSKKTDDEVKLDIDIKTNNTGDEILFTTPTPNKTPDSSCSSANPSSLNDNLNKLKFLAHLHHSVYEIGKLPRKPLNLCMIQQMIDEARRHIGTVVVGEGEGNDTKCTPIRLNELNLDLEWSSKQDPSTKNTFLGEYPSSMDKTVRTREEIIAEYLRDTPDNNLKRGCPLRSPYSENFMDPEITFQEEPVKLQQEIGDGWLFNKVEKKREIAQPEALFGSEYNDLASSLKLFNSNVKQPVNVDDFYDDYTGDSEVRERNTPKEDEDDDDDESSSDNQDNELFGRKKKKKKKRKKKKKKKYYKKSNQDGQDNREAIVEFPSNSRVSPSEFVFENDVMAVPSNEASEEEPRIKEVPKDEYFNGFSELGDIKFRVNSDQEEAIEKFIESLNSPPEVFNFDVDKYIQTKSVIDPPIHIETQPQKTFYEFLMPPAIENEKVPYIAEDSPQTHPEGAFGASKESRNVHNKRDILRQYIKGISSHIMDNYPAPHAQINEKPDSKVQTRSNPILVNRDEALITNYANDLDVLNYGRYDSEPKEPNADDFIDKFYLLNDGSFSVYGTDKGTAKQDQQSRIDPINIDIDLELDKKFKDLNIIKPCLGGKCTNMECSKDKELDASREIFNNIGTMYIPPSNFPKPDLKENVGSQKSCDKYFLPFKRK